MKYIQSIGQLATSTRLRYLSHVEVAHLRLHGSRQPRDAAVVEDIRARLKREQMGQGLKQASPATQADVLRAFALEPRTLGPIAVVQFATASRFGDLQGVEAADANLEDDVIYIHLRRTKTSLSTGPRIVLIVLGRLPQHTISAVRALLNQREPFVCEYRAYIALLTKVRPDLSAHSLRRGAVQLAMRTAHDQHVMRLTGHRSVETLARYAGVLPQTWKAEMMAAADAVWR
jgi:hypothetical protein